MTVLGILPNQPLFQISRCQELKSPQPNCDILTPARAEFLRISPNHTFQRFHHCSGTVNWPSPDTTQAPLHPTLQLSALNKCFRSLFSNESFCRLSFLAYNSKLRFPPQLPVNLKSFPCSSSGSIPATTPCDVPLEHRSHILKASRVFFHPQLILPASCPKQGFFTLKLKKIFWTWNTFKLFVKVIKILTAQFRKSVTLLHSFWSCSVCSWEKTATQIRFIFSPWFF